jgi:hypothetical protein
MEILNVVQIDTGFASWTMQVTDLSTRLVELDNHPGLEHIRTYSPTGQTAQRWTATEASLAKLWEDLASATALLQAAHAVRGSRPNLDDGNRAELTRMFNDPAGLTDTLHRMDVAWADITEVLDAVVDVNTMVAAGIAGALRQFDATGSPTPQEITDLLSVAATDPLSLTADDVARRLAVIDELAALHSDWPNAIAMTQRSLDELGEARQRALQTREQAKRTVLAELPMSEDVEPKLRSELASLTASDAVALQSLRRRVASAHQLVRHDDELAQGLLDRRNELKGRLKAYGAKAARLGLAQDPDLLSSHRIASSLLSRRPCDLRSITHAVTDFQKLLSGKRGAMR